MSHQNDLQKELELWQRRLQKRREQKAALGILADPSIDIEIEDIEARVRQLQADLLAQSPAPRPQATALPAIEVTPPDPELASLRGQPRIFLCHASEDKSRVIELYHQLKDAGYRPWLDKFDLLPGQNWWREIEQIIRDPYNLVVIFLSNHSVTKRGVVQREIKRALDVLDEMPENTIYLIPARLESCQPIGRLAHLHWVDIFESDGFENLMRALDFELRQRAVKSPSEPIASDQPDSKQVRAYNLLSDKPTSHSRNPHPQHSFEPELILIPADEFLMGSDPKKDRDARDDEQPQHTLYLPDYYIGKYPVTNAQYAVFVEATNHRHPKHWENDNVPKDKQDHPVVYINWQDVVVYCQWLAQITKKSYRPPTEAEWEKAARGTDGRIFPWGDEWDSKRCNTYESGPRDTTPVGSYLHGASPYGILDMSDNVCEWTMSLWGKDYKKPDFNYPYDPTDGRENLNTITDMLRVLRGASWGSNWLDTRCASHLSEHPDYESEFIGFRLAMSPS